MSYGLQNELLRAYSQGAKDIAKRHRPRKEFREILKQLRRDLNMSQMEFATAFGLAFSNVKNWEQPSRGSPKGVAELYLKLIQHDPETMERLVKEIQSEDNQLEHT